MTARSPGKGGPIVAFPKPPELAAIRGARCGVIEASAGTGKTYTLEHLVVDLVLDGVPIDGLLVVTFTEKATSELERRVRAKLHEILRAAEAPVAERRAPAGDSAWLVDDRGRARLREAIAAFDRATITTIHGFCQRVLTEHAFASGRLFQQELGDALSLFSAAFRDSLRRDLAASPALRPYLAAHLALGKSVGALEELLFAAADAAASGCPLGPPYDPQRLAAAVAGARAAAPTAAALREATAAVKLPKAKQKALLVRLERLLALLAGAEGGDAFADAPSAALPLFLARVEEAEADFKSNGLFPYVRENLAPLTEGPPPLAAFARAVLALDEALVPFPAALVAALLPPVLARLARRKRAAGLLDFGDMLTLVDESLDGEDGAALAARLRRRFRAALIDEFQDTDDVQWRIFRRLFLAEEGETQLYVIGDPKQAIYAFRGADVLTYLRARDAIAAAGGSRVSLARNFRATAAMTEACNTIFAPEGEAQLFGGAIRFDQPVTCGRPEGKLFDADDGAHEAPPLALLALEPRDETEPRLGALRAALAEGIAAEIEALLARPPIWTGEGRPRPLEASDLFVLTRTGSEGIEIGEALRRRRVPHAFYKQEGLFATDEAAAIEDLLAALADPHDPSKRLRALLTPFFDLTLEDLAALGTLDPTHPLVARLDAWRAIAEARDYERLFARLLDDSGLVRRQLFFGGSERAIVNVQHLFEILLEEVGRARLDPRELCWLLGAFRSGRRRPACEDPDVQRLETERHAVQIMTMHKAKGLEAAVVFVYGGFARLPSRGEVRVHHQNGVREAHVGRPRDAALKELCQREQDEEDERLLYVALTRAKARLYLPLFDFASPGRRGDDGDGDGARTDGFRHLTGGYRPLDRRLRALLRSEGFSALCRRIAIPCASPIAAAAEPSGPARAPARLPWPPPAELLEPPAISPLAELRKRHAGTLVTSYSQLKGLRGGYAAPEAVEADAPGALDEADAEAEGAPGESHHSGPSGGGAAAPDLLDEELPGGARVGVFLHTLLETAPLATLAAAPAPGPWAADPAVRACFDERFRSDELDARFRPACERLVHAALTAPFSIGAGRIPGLAQQAQAPLREVEFLFPAPGQPRGFVKGVIDVLCQHEGRAYALDWKSDRLPPGIDASGLAQHVAQNYELQARLYTLGLLRMLGVSTEEEHEARFGGLLYVFLRARPIDAGTVFLRPSFGETRSWEEELARDERWRWLSEL